MIAYSKPYSNSYAGSYTDFNTAIFRYREIDGILIESGTGLSVPKSINYRRDWKFGGYNCRANRRISDYVINCTNNEKNRQYIYSPKKGITQFEFKCKPGEYCKFNLMSQHGIFFGFNSAP